MDEEKTIRVPIKLVEAILNSPTRDVLDHLRRVAEMEAPEKFPSRRHPKE